MEIITLAVVFLIGLVTGFVDSVVGSGGLISIPSLIILGLPPQVAIATDRFGTLGQYVGALPKFWKEKKIVWAYVLPLVLISIIGAYIGANILLAVDAAFLTKAIGLTILAILPLMFLKKDMGVKKEEVKKGRRLLGYFIFVFVMILASSIGGGIGILGSYVLMFFFGFTIIESMATAKIPWLFLSLISLVIFAINGIIDYALGIILVIGMFIGGYIGAHVAIQKGDEWVKLIFAAVVVISGIKLLFFQS